MEFGGILWLVLLFLVFWFFLIRPQQQRERRRRDMLAALKVGDRVITIGGFHGIITRVDDQTVRLKLSDDLEVQLQKSGVGTIVRPAGE